MAKAEWTHGEANPRFVVTSRGRHECKAKYLYEKVLYEETSVKRYFIAKPLFLFWLFAFFSGWI